MRRLFSGGVFLLLAGCQGINGPFQTRSTPPPPIKDPCVSTAEQLRRSRDQLAFPDGSSAVLPRTGAELPNYYGR